MRKLAKDAMELMLTTRDGQRLDIMIDRACLDATEKVASTTKDRFLSDYAEKKVVIADIMDSVDENKVIVSIAAGKTINWMASEFEKPTKIIRVMPNTPALVGEGCSAVCRNDLVSDSDFHFVIELLESFGKAYTVPETLMDVVVGVSGSSPAYVFLFIEAMADAAVAGGMPRKQAYEFAAQSVLGSAKMVLETGKHPGELKDMVCSPAGTTIEAVRVLEEEGFRGTVMDAVTACIDKSKSL
jgi:pyrroline-5-carboxylate reductase